MLASFRWWAPWLPPKISSPGPCVRSARRRREHLGPDGIARVHRAAGREEARSLRESHADAPGKAAEAAVRRAGDGVLLEEDDRNAPKTRRQDTRHRRVAADPDHQSGPETANQRESARDAASQGGRTRHGPAHAAAPHLPAGDQVQRPTRRGDQARLQPARAAGELDRQALFEQRAAERERGEDVPPRPATGDQDVETGQSAQPDSRARASSTPTSASDTIIADPPYETNGRVSPLVGSMPSATATFSTPCTTMSDVIPKASSDPKSSGWRAAMRNPRAATAANKARTSAGADQPELLADDGEDEVGVGGWQVVHLLLALPQADARQAARAEGDERLAELEAVAERVLPAVQERHQTPPPVRRRHRQPDQRRHGGRREHPEMQGPRPRREQHEHQKHARQRRGPEIRLRETEHRHDGHHHAVGQHAAYELAHPVARPRERARQEEDQRQLGELARLEGERSERQPASCAAAHRPDAGDQDRDHEHERDAEERIGEAAILVRADPHGDHAEHDADADGDHVLAEEVQRIAEVVTAREPADVEDHHQAERHQRGNRQHQPGIAPERPDDAWPLVGQRSAEKRPRLERGIECFGPRHRIPSTAARNARPRAA